MSWTAIAKKDVQDSVRAKTLWGVIAVFFVLIGGLTYLVVDAAGAQEDVLEILAGFTFFLGIGLFVPIAGLLLSIKAIARERDSGTINLLLSLPHSRGDMMVGKFLGRTAVMAIATIVGFVPALLIVLLEVDDSGGIGTIFVFLFVAVLIGMMFVAIGVGLSALVNSETQATVGGITLFFVLYFWPFIVNRILSLADAELPEFAERFWLFNMFLDMANALAPEGEGFGGASNATSSIDPGIFMQNWFAFVILALWVAVPLGIGYARFNKMDL